VESEVMKLLIAATGAIMLPIQSTKAKREPRIGNSTEMSSHSWRKSRFADSVQSRQIDLPRNDRNLNF